MKVSRKSIRRRVWQGINVFVVLAVLFSAVAPAVAMAAPPAAPSSQEIKTNGQCEQVNDTENNRSFLPLITRSAQSIVASAQNSIAGPLVVDRELKYEVGKTYVYDYDVTVITQSSSRSAEGVTSSDKSKTVMQAHAELTITDQEEDGTFVGQIVMLDPFVCSADLENNQESIADTAELAEALTTPLVFKQRKNGVIASVSYASDASATVINLQKGIINALQATLQGDDSYTVDEVGGQGTYRAKYELSEQDDKLNITKTYDQGSFDEANKKGDEIDSLKLDSEIVLVLDGARGVIESVESSEIMTTGDGDAEPNDYTDDVDFDGTTAWSTVNSTGQLTLKDVKDATNMYAAAADVVYVEGGLEPIFGEDIGNDQAIDLATVNLDEEFAAFEAEPDNADLFQRIMQLYYADTETVVFDKIVDRLRANPDNVAIANGYVDLLTSIGTAEAQAVLVDVVNPAAQAAAIGATMTMTTQEQALINLVLVESPTEGTVGALESLSDNEQSDFHDTAISVLGAAIHNLADEDAATAQSLADALVARLNEATEQDNVEVLLDALGNAGMPATLDTIADYTDIQATGSISETDTIEAAAFNALRKIPGDQAEDLLVAALGDEEQPNGTRLLVADILADRPDLSQEGAAALADFNIADLASSGTYTRQWGAWLGNSKLGTYLPGRFTVSSINQLYLYADQQANAYVWNNKIPLARGQLLSHRYGSYQKFGAYLNLGGNLVRKSYVRYLPCSYSQNGTLYSGGHSWKKSVQIPVVWVITIGVDVQVSVSAALDYNYSANVCNINNSSLTGGITPRVGANASAEAYLNLRLARGGVGINAKILYTLMPSSLTLSYNGSTFRFCSDVRIVSYPLSGYIYGFADVGVDAFFFVYWKRVFKGTLASFSVGQVEYRLLVRCW